MIDECGECIAADLRRYYGLDIRDVMREGSGLSPRLVLVYIRQLPPESATVAAIRGGEQYRGWDPQLYMLANVFDAVRENTYAFIAANSKKKPKPPEPIERPEKKVKKKTGAFAAMARAAFMRNNSQKGP